VELGRERYGQLGDSSLQERWLPARVLGIDNVSAVAAGNGHALALRRDGTVWVWGDRTSGALGLGDVLPTQTVPVQVPGLSGITAINALGASSSAVRSDGTVLTWGVGFHGDSAGQLVVWSPAPMPGLTGAVSVESNALFGLAALSNGAAVSWGSNVSGELADGTLLHI